MARLIVSSKYLNFTGGEGYTSIPLTKNHILSIHKGDEGIYVNYKIDVRDKTHFVFKIPKKENFDKIASMIIFVFHDHVQYDLDLNFDDLVKEF